MNEFVMFNLVLKFVLLKKIVVYYDDVDELKIRVLMFFFGFVIMIWINDFLFIDKCDEEKL